MILVDQGVLEEEFDRSRLVLVTLRGSLCLSSTPGRSTSQERTRHQRLLIITCAVMNPSVEDNKQPSVTDVASVATASRPRSVLARFLEVRGLEMKKKPSAELAKPSFAISGPSSTKARIPVRAMWHGYSRRRCGDHVDFQRRAMQIPDESFSDSVDVYNPKKRAMCLIKVHEEADVVRDQFLYYTRRLLFEREVVDHPVCDLLENRDEHDARLDQIHYDDAGDEQEDEKTGGPPPE